MIPVSDFIYYLLSTDTKPTTAPNGLTMASGSICVEVDTGSRFYWSGTAWVAMTTAQTTINTSAGEETALTRIVRRVNEERAAKVPPLPPLTNAQYMDALLSALSATIADYRRQEMDLVPTDVKTAYAGATPAIRT